MPAGASALAAAVRLRAGGATIGARLQIQVSMLTGFPTRWCAPSTPTPSCLEVRGLKVKLLSTMESSISISEAVRALEEILDETEKVILASIDGDQDACARSAIKIKGMIMGLIQASALNSSRVLDSFGDAPLSVGLIISSSQSASLVEPAPFHRLTQFQFPLPPPYSPALGRTALYHPPVPPRAFFPQILFYLPNVDPFPRPLCPPNHLPFERFYQTRFPFNAAPTQSPNFLYRAPNTSFQPGPRQPYSRPIFPYRPQLHGPVPYRPQVRPPLNASLPCASLDPFPRPLRPSNELPFERFNEIRYRAPNMLSQSAPREPFSRPFCPSNLAPSHHCPRGQLPFNEAVAPEFSPQTSPSTLHEPNLGSAVAPEHNPCQSLLQGSLDGDSVLEVFLHNISDCEQLVEIISDTITKKNKDAFTRNLNKMAMLVKRLQNDRAEERLASGST